MKRLKNRRGQGMIEYLILVALIAVGSMAIVRVVGKNVSVQFANIAKALGSGSGGEIKAESLDQSMYSKRDMSNFLNGAINESARDQSRRSR